MGQISAWPEDGFGAWVGRELCSERWDVLREFVLSHPSDDAAVARMGTHGSGEKRGPGVGHAPWMWRAHQECCAKRGHCGGRC